jgi:TolB-like protein
VGLAPLVLGHALSARYTLERELGRGGMATVYLARDLREARLVALKLLRPEVAAALGTERFLREIRLTAQLQHAHILGLLDSGEVEGSLYYTLPYVAGESLRARLKGESQLPVDEALRIATEIAEALAYAHAQGVVHRDIKPENILLETTESETRALMTDFGIAQALDLAGGERLTATGLVIGTPAYMSPEQASGEAVDGRSDLYSLGCVLYEMLGGEPPYTGPTGQAILAKQAKAPVPHLRALRPEIPSAVEQAVTRALAKSPADRFATAEQLAAALAARESAATVRLPRWRARRMPAVALGLLLVGAAMAGSAVLLRHRSRAATPAASADARRVVVAVFQNQTGDPSLDPLGDIVADYLARGLAETRVVEVLDERAAKRGTGAAHVRGSNDVRTLARQVGAGSVLWGEYSRRGDSLEFQAELTDAGTGKQLATIPPAMGSAVQQTQGVEVLRQRVMAALAERFDARLTRFADSSGSHAVSYEAYREFLAGDTMHMDVPRDWGLAHLRRAYELDTNFTLPLVQIAAMGSFWGQECERIDSIADLLRPRHDRLPLYDQALLDPAVARCHGQREKAMALLREAMTLFPSSGLLAESFAWHARHNGYLRKAIAVTEKLEHSGCDALYFGNLMIPYHLLGEHQRELEVAQQARHDCPGDLQTLSFEARALVGLGRLAEVNARVEEMLRVPQEARQDQGAVFAIDEIGRDLSAHGHREEAKLVFERGIRYYEALPPAAQADQRMDFAQILYDLGRWTEVLPIMQQNDLDTRATLGAVYARLGDRRAVAQVDRWLAARHGPYLNGGNTRARARLAAILGDRERAVALLHHALDEGAFLDGGHGLGLHSDPDFESLRDYPPFQELTRPKD